MEQKIHTLWVDFRTNKVEEDRLTFPQFSKLMKMDKDNDVQILVYDNIYARVRGN